MELYSDDMAEALVFFSDQQQKSGSGVDYNYCSHQ